MKLRGFWIFILFVVSSHSTLVSQCLNPVTGAGLFCNTDASENPAPIICDLDCLDGFTATMPDSLFGMQPETLCATGGVPNNLSWFAFVAGSTTVSITITPFNCTEELDDMGNVVNNTVGIQAGIYSSCVFEPENNVACHSDCSSNSAQPITLDSDQFVEGQVYYLFVDGCGGSVCDYTVTVNDGEQAFQMQEITTISNNYNLNLPSDTVCAGANIEFTLDNFDLDVGFQWGISPSTSDYPSGELAVQDTNVIDMVFNEEGTYEIFVFAFNECDESDTVRFNIIVEALENEIFTPLEVCQECLINGLVLVTSTQECVPADAIPVILIEDPNNDGVPGWQGIDPIFSTGLDSFEIVNQFGCSFYQIVEIDQIPLPAREPVDIYYCLGDFPVTDFGLTFSAPGDSENITLDNQAVSGCDSLIQITAHAIDIIGTTNVSDCDNGEVTIAFNPISISPADNDSIVFQWMNTTGIVEDGNTDDTSLIVTASGTYSLDVTVWVDGVGCSQSFVGIDIDPDNLVPNVPSIAFRPEFACQSDGLAQIFVSNQALGEQYNWTIDPPLPFDFGITTDTIFVDISGGQSFEFCVSAENGCGVSSEMCEIVNVTIPPMVSFISQDTICIDEVLFVEYTGEGGNASTSEFTWDFDGGQVVNGASVLEGGPFDVSFIQGGVYNISVSLFENGCTSVEFTKEVVVDDPFVAPMINCTPGTGEVSFMFDDTNVTSLSINVLSGSGSINDSNGEVIVTGLGNEETVELEFIFNENSACGSTSVTAMCTSLSCANVDLELVLTENNLCLNDEVNDIEVIVMIDGVVSNNAAISSPFIEGNNIFNVRNAGPGEHVISFDFDQNGCAYSVDSTIFLFQTPEIEIEQFTPFCEEEGERTITISSDIQVSVMVNGENVSSLMDIPVTEDVATIVAVSADGCSIEREVLFEEILLPVPLIDGELEVIEGSTNTYSNATDITGFDADVNWYLNDELICENCDQVDGDDIFGELCLEILYSENCISTSCVDIVVQEKTEIYIPNAFSPNGDGVNDIFYFQSNDPDIIINTFVVYDRWGALVFNWKGDENNMNWDGMLNNDPLTSGVYVYMIEYINELGQRKIKRGDVTLFY